MEFVFYEDRKSVRTIRYKYSITASSYGEAVSAIVKNDLDLDSCGDFISAQELEEEGRVLNSELLNEEGEPVAIIDYDNDGNN